METEHDVIIIGSGPLGAICARRLAEHGLNVLIVESGKAVSSPPGDHIRNQDRFQADPDSFMAEALERCQFYDTKAPESGLPGANETRALGGQGIIWTNNCPRPTFYFPKWTVFDRRKWESHLAAAEEMLRVHTDLFDSSIRQQKVSERLGAYLQSNMAEREISKMPTAAARTSDGRVQFTATHEILSAPPAVLRIRKAVYMDSRI